MKNCEPLVFGPLFAMERRNLCSCFKSKFSSEGERERDPHQWGVVHISGCGSHQWGVVHINGVWFTSVGCGSHQWGVVHISGVWFTSMGCGSHQWGVAHTGQHLTPQSCCRRTLPLISTQHYTPTPSHTHYYSDARVSYQGLVINHLNRLH